MSDSKPHDNSLEDASIEGLKATPLKPFAAFWEKLSKEWKQRFAVLAFWLLLYPVVSLAAALTIIGALPHGWARDAAQRYILQSVGVDAAMNSDLDQSNKAIDASLPISFDGGSSNRPPFYFRLVRGQTVKFWVRLQPARTSETGQVCDTVNTSGGSAAPRNPTATFATLTFRAPSASQLNKDFTMSDDQDGQAIDVVKSEDWAKVTGDDTTFPVAINLYRNEPSDDPKDDPFYKCWSYTVLVDMDVYKPSHATAGAAKSGGGSNG
jgi:hypothetical protein